jgi:hypothetical protein
MVSQEVKVQVFSPCTLLHWASGVAYTRLLYNRLNAIGKRKPPQKRVLTLVLGMCVSQGIWFLSVGVPLGDRFNCRLN